MSDTLTLLEPTSITLRPLQQPSEPTIEEITWYRRLSEAMVFARGLLATETPKANGKSAIIFDIDDTILNTNSPSGRQSIMWNGMQLQHFNRIEPVYNLYRELIDRGFKIIFLTARVEKSDDKCPVRDVYEATKENLYLTGFNVYDQLMCMTRAERTMFKPPEWKEMMRINFSEAHGYDIIATIDDQPENLQGAYTGYSIQIPRREYALAEAKSNPHKTKRGKKTHRPILTPQEYQEQLTQKINYADSLLQQADSNKKNLVILDIDGVALGKTPLEFYIPLSSGRRLPYFEAIPEVLSLYKKLIEREFHIIFLTERIHEDLGEGTKENLMRVGYTQFDKIIAFPRELYRRTPACFWKENMRINLSFEYNIVATIDDTPENLLGDSLGYPIKLPYLNNRLIYGDFIAPNWQIPGYSRTIKPSVFS